jgi:hypothetical protein
MFNAQAHPIVGDRFKCLDCAEFDLCTACHEVGGHAETQHVFVRIPDPEDAHRLISEARGNHIAQAPVRVIVRTSIARGAQQALMCLFSFFSFLLGLLRLERPYGCSACHAGVSAHYCWDD